VLDGNGGQPHAPATLTLIKSSDTHSTGGWADLRTGLDGYGEYKISYAHRSSNTGPLMSSRTTIPSNLSPPQDSSTQLVNVTWVSGRKWSVGIGTARLGDLSCPVLVLPRLRDFQFLSTIHQKRKNETTCKSFTIILVTRWLTCPKNQKVSREVTVLIEA